jgi:starch synthase
MPVRAKSAAPTAPPRVLFITSEVRPLVKTGGLGDVSADLPPALRALGVDCRLLLPGYHGVLAGVRRLRWRATWRDIPGYGEVHLLAGTMPDTDVPVYVIDAPYHYLREGGPYLDAHGHDWPDNAWRFALLSHVALRMALEGSDGWQPDILHGNDWQAGLMPALAHYLAPSLGTVMTIHNLAYQGIFPASLAGLLGLPLESFDIEGVEYHDQLSFLKAGLFYASRIATVSPTYAQEIQSAPLGMGMEGLLATRANDLTGILNGIDTALWNPRDDPHLPAHYKVRSMAGKAACKRQLQIDLGLEQVADRPLFGVVSRFTEQKGLDWVAEIAPALIASGAQLAVLGSGDAALEAAFRALAQAHPGQIATVIGYDEGLAHRIEAGADFFLMPSRFEPCGLNQMYSQRYGTPPIVHATGGLADTVEDGVTGFVFPSASAPALWLAIQRALDLYTRKAKLTAMRTAGMKRDFSWENSARAYAGVYEGVSGKR